MDYKKCFITFQKCNITKKHLIKTKKMLHLQIRVKSDISLIAST